VVGLDVRHLQGFAHPLAQPFGDLLPLRIGAFSAARSARFVEERLSDLPPFLDVSEEALLDEVLVDRNAAEPVCTESLIRVDAVMESVQPGDIGNRSYLRHG
jgi:hypothetical protein